MWAGTLPDHLYQKEVRVGEKVDLNEPHEDPEQEARDLPDFALSMSSIPTIMKTNVYE